MTDVACFCGCLYSFDGGGAACPKCGEYATVAAGPGFKSTERSCPEQPAADMNGAGQNRQVAGEGAGAVGSCDRQSSATRTPGRGHLDRTEAVSG
jgi:hypothetical protein